MFIHAKLRSLKILSIAFNHLLIHFYRFIKESLTLLILIKNYAKAKNKFIGK